MTDIFETRQAPEKKRPALKQQNEEIVKRLREQINIRKEHLGNIVMQEYSGRDMGDNPLSKEQYMFLIDLKIHIRDELDFLQSILGDKI